MVYLRKLYYVYIVGTCNKGYLDKIHIVGEVKIIKNTSIVKTVFSGPCGKAELFPS